AAAVPLPRRPTPRRLIHPCPPPDRHYKRRWSQPHRGAVRRPESTPPMSRKARQRTRRLPIRMQLMLPIAPATMGMLVLGLFQTVHVWGEYQDATDAAVLSDLAGSVADVLDGHQKEGGPVLEAVLTGSADEIDLDTLRGRTD